MKRMFPLNTNTSLKLKKKNKIIQKMFQWEHVAVEHFPKNLSAVQL